MIQGWGYPRYNVTTGGLVSTLIGVPPNQPPVKKFVTLGSGPYLIGYNSRRPVVVYGQRTLKCGIGFGRPIPRRSRWTKAEPVTMPAPTKATRIAQEALENEICDSGRHKKQLRTTQMWPGHRLLEGLRSLGHQQVQMAVAGKMLGVIRAKHFTEFTPSFFDRTIHALKQDRDFRVNPGVLAG